MVFFNILNFFAILLEFSLARWEGTKRCDNFYSLFLSIFQPIMAWNEAATVFFNLLFFWNLLLPVETERNGAIIFIFSLSQRFPTYFGLE